MRTEFLNIWHGGTQRDCILTG